MIETNHPTRLDEWYSPFTGVDASRLPAGLHEIIRCPQCDGGLEALDFEMRCMECDSRYASSSHQIDLRPKRPRAVNCTFMIENPVAAIDLPVLGIPFAPGADPAEQNFPEPLAYGNGLTPQLVSWFPKIAGGRLLDLGCGTRRTETVTTRTGATYVGLDIMGEAPHVLGRGEILPFVDDSFDFVLSMAVFPHTTYPDLAVREAYRVLRPGCLLIGTAQFIEACFMTSRHHVTAFGVLDWLHGAGFEIVHMEPNDLNWDGGQALIGMQYLAPIVSGRRRRVARAALRGVMAFAGKRNPMNELGWGQRYPEGFTGGFRFVARKPASPGA